METPTVGNQIHRLCRPPVLAPKDFEGERFVNLAEGDPYRQAIDAPFAKAHLRRATLLETASAVAVCPMSPPQMVVRPLTETIALNVDLLVSQVPAPHPLQMQ